MFDNTPAGTPASPSGAPAGAMPPAPSAPVSAPVPSPTPAASPVKRDFAQFLADYAPPAEPDAPPVSAAPAGDAPTNAAEPAADAPLSDEEWQQFEPLLQPGARDSFDPSAIDLEALSADPAQLRAVTERLLGERNSAALTLGNNILEVVGPGGEGQAQQIAATVLADMFNPTGTFDENGTQYTNGQRLGAYLNRSFPEAARAIALDTVQFEPDFVRENFDTLLERLAAEPAFNETFVRRAEVTPFLDTDLQSRAAEFLKTIPAELHDTFRSLPPQVQDDVLQRGKDVALRDLRNEHRLAQIEAAQQQQQQQRAQQQYYAREQQVARQVQDIKLGSFRALMADAKALGFSELEARGLAAQAWEQVESEFFAENSKWLQLDDAMRDAARRGDVPSLKRVQGQLTQAIFGLYKQGLRGAVKPAQVRAKLQPKPVAPAAAPSTSGAQFIPAQPPGGPRGKPGAPIPAADFAREWLFGQGA